MKVEQIGPTFWVPEKTINFFGVKPVVPPYTLKMRKSHKKSAHVYAYTHAYTQIRDGGGKSTCVLRCTNCFWTTRTVFFYDFCGHKMVKY